MGEGAARQTRVQRILRSNGVPLQSTNGAGGTNQTRAQCILRSGRRPGCRAPAIEATSCHARQSPPRSPIHDTHVARRAARPPPRSPIYRDTHHSVGVRSPPRSPARHAANTARHTRRSPPSSPTATSLTTPSAFDNQHARQLATPLTSTRSGRVPGCRAPMGGGTGIPRAPRDLRSGEVPGCRTP